MRKGREGEIYNIGGNRSLPNLDVIHKVLELTGKPDSLIEYVKDRPGHDRRYALSSEKLMRETGWSPVTDFETGLAETIGWYRANSAWVAGVRSGAYRTYYERNYGNRAVAASARAMPALPQVDSKHPCEWRLKRHRWRFRAAGYSATPPS